MSKTHSTQKPAIGYCRVSTHGQADSGVSLQAQQERIRAMAVAHGLELAEIVVDAGESAKSLERPGLERLLEMVRKGQVSSVLIFKLDRLTRSVKDLGTLLELFAQKRTSLISISESLDTGSAGGRLVTNLLMSVAQWERECCSERTALALRHKRDSRLVWNHTPFGYRREGGSLVPLPEEQAVIQQILSLRAEGRSLRAIAEVLNSAGVPSKMGGTWKPQVVSDVLRLNSVDSSSEAAA